MFKKAKRYERNSYNVYGNIKIIKEKGVTKIKTKVGEFTCVKYSIFLNEAG